MRRKEAGPKSSQPNPPMPPPIAKILGVPIWGLCLEEFVELAKNLIEVRHKVLFTTIGLPSIVISQKSLDFFNHFQQADVVLPDGIFPVWAARFLKHKVLERVSGPDFVDLFLSTAEQEGFKIFFIGSTDDTLERLKSNCLEKHPHLKITGVLAPPFGKFDEEIDRGLVNTINEAHPDVLFVGMTAPKQELWLARNFERLDVLFAMGVGATFDYLAGKKGRAPKWIGKCGLEWLYRLVHEPRRLCRRNVNSAVFLWLLVKNYVISIFRR